LTVAAPIPDTPRPVPNWFRNLCLLVGGCVLGVLALEGVLRTAGWAFRQMREPPRVVADGTIRVLCLGESTTADMDFLGVESYPAQLQRALNARGGAPATS
jgi:hypothetical protein